MDGYCARIAVALVHVLRRSVVIVQARNADSLLLHNFTMSECDCVPLDSPPFQPERRGSSTSVRSLEDLLTCPIHKDLLEDARSLPCGHVFCRACLDQLLHNRGLKCPMCRVEHQIPTNGASGLPAMYTQNRIVQYITDKKQERALRSLHESAGASADQPFSIATKTDLLKRLVEDISAQEPDGSAVEHAGRRVCIEELNTLLQSLQRKNMTRPSPVEAQAPRVSDSDLTSSSIAELNSVENQRRVMHRSCLYKKELRVDLKTVMRGLRVACVDFLESPHPVSSDRYTAVILEASLTRLFLLTHINGSTRCERYQPRVGTDTQGPMLIHYLQCLNGCVHLCVEYQSSGGRVGMMLQCDVSGRLLSRSPLVSAREEPEVPSPIRHPPVCGFYYDDQAREYLVSRPSEGKVSLWSDNYRSKCDYNFDCYEAHPYYVVRAHDSHEVWMSCPTDKIIVILDEITNVWKKLDTAAIYNSVPGHLSITTGDRIIFVDVTEQRLFWMTRMGNNLPVQRLVFRGLNLSRLTGRENQHIVCIRGLENNKLMLATENFLMVCRPGVRDKNFECSVL